MNFMYKFTWEFVYEIKTKEKIHMRNLRNLWENFELRKKFVWPKFEQTNETTSRHSKTSSFDNYMVTVA